MENYKDINYKDFEFWDMEKLWKLRGEICLGSLFLKDYKNSFGIPTGDCSNFFDGFLDDCFDIEIEEGRGDGITIQTIYELYDNKESLWDYFSGVEYPFG